MAGPLGKKRKKKAKSFSSLEEMFDGGACQHLPWLAGPMAQSPSRKEQKGKDILKAREQRVKSQDVLQRMQKT